MQVEDLENKDLVEIQNLSLRVQLAAAAIGSSLLLIFIPNVETITFTAFLVGFLFSTRFALSITFTMVIGWEIFASIIFAFSGITFFFKLLAWFIITLIGAGARKMNVKKAYEFAILGTVSALIFDFLVTIPYALFFVNDRNNFLSVFIATLTIGIYFTIFHIIGNTVLFSMIPKLIDTLYPILENRYATITQIDKSYFNVKTRPLLAMLLVGILVTSIIGIALISYNNQTQTDINPNIIIITIEFDYANLRDFEDFTLNISSDDSVFIIMKKVVNINYTTKWGLPYIQAINGVGLGKNQSLSGFNWIHYVNGIYANRGASINYVSNSDVILWRYE